MLSNAERYRAYASTIQADTTWHLWDHEAGETVADRDGRTEMSQRDAMDLEQEYRHS